MGIAVSLDLYSEVDCETGGLMECQICGTLMYSIGFWYWYMVEK